MNKVPPATKSKGGDAPKPKRPVNGMRVHVRARLRELGQEQGKRLTLAWLAKRSRCGPSTLGDFLSQRHRTNPGTIRLVLKALDWDENDLYGTGGAKKKVIKMPERNAKRRAK